MIPCDEREEPSECMSPTCPGDGQQILVGRLWPRGLSRERAAIGAWAKELASSDWGRSPRARIVLKLDHEVSVRRVGPHDPRFSIL